MHSSSVLSCDFYPEMLPLLSPSSVVPFLSVNLFICQDLRRTSGFEDFSSLFFGRARSCLIQIRLEPSSAESGIQNQFFHLGALIGFVNPHSTEFGQGTPFLIEHEHLDLKTADFAR